VAEKTIMEQRLLPVVAILVLVVGGCATYNQKSVGMVDCYLRGDYPTAAAEASAMVEKGEKQDRLLLRLEQGSALRAAGQLQASNQALDVADALFAEFDEKAKIRVGREAFAAVTNLSLIDYEGYGYDRIMMNVYKALNYMEMGQMDSARIELRRVGVAQQKSAQRYAAKIENAERARKQKDPSVGFDVDRTMDDPKFQKELESHYADLPDLEAHAVYVNPFAEYLQGLFFLYAGDAEDREVGRTALRNAAGMINNPYVKQEAVRAEQVASTGRIQPMTYVIFETGLAPMRDQFRITLYMVINGRLVDFHAAFPFLRRQEGAIPYMSVQAGGAEHRTVTVADMDRIIGQEFKNELPAVVTRTLIASSVKAAASYAAREAARRRDGRGGWAEAVANIGTVLYQEVMNQADLRTWRTLPKQIQVASFPTPPDRKITLSMAGGPPFATVELIPATVNVVCVTCPSPMARPAIHQFKLK